MGNFSRAALERYTYLLLLFFLPTQLGKHFWPDFAFIGGLRIDYLSPTIYFTDCLLVLLFIFFMSNVPFHIFLRPELRAKAHFTFEKGKFFLLLIFFFCVSMGIFFSTNPLAGLLGGVKLSEMVFFGWYTARFLGKTIPLSQAFFVLSASVVFQSVLALSQFWTKASLGGIFYYFGERSFTMLTPGIANASLQGSLVLRPYGTLPHPNVLAGFLLLGMLFVIGVWSLTKTRMMTLVVICALFFGAAALLVSLSRIPILLFVGTVLLVGIWMLKQRILKRYLFIMVIGSLCIGIGLLFTPLVGRFLSTSFLEEAFVIRQDLAMQALWMIQAHPFFGVGLQNFLNNLPQTLTSWSYYTRIQPVHNIYLLVFAELGIIAGGIVLYFLWKTLRHVQKAQTSWWQKTVFSMLVVMLVLGMFDHYFLTLQQGRLLFAFVLGLCWSFPYKTTQKNLLEKIKKRSKSKNNYNR